MQIESGESAHNQRDDSSHEGSSDDGSISSIELKFFKSPPIGTLSAQDAFQNFANQ